MEPLFHSASSVAAMAASTLFSAVWEGAILAACIFVCLRIFPNLSAAARSVIWMNVFALLVLLQVLPFVGAHAANVSAGHPAPFELDVKWSVVIAGAWASLSLLRAAQLIASAARLHGLAKRATPVAADAELSTLLRIRILNTDRSAELCTSNEVERPSVLGFLHPRILLPPDLLNRLTPAELRQVVLHEMEHLHRGDDWTNLLQKLALVFFPLNPALLWVEHRLCAERELACDDSVLRSSCGRKAYAICLTRLAEHSMLRRSLSLALGAWERQSELVRRVHRILRRPTQGMGRTQTMALTGSLCVALLACTFGLARSPQLVGFAAPHAQAAVQALPPLPIRQADIGQEGLLAHALMVKAMMPQRALENTSAAKLISATKPAQKNAALRRNRQRYPATQQAWIVMTGWSDMDAMPQIVLAVAQEDNDSQNQSVGGNGQSNRMKHSNQIDQSDQINQGDRIRRVSYAAVPFANGWLIVEI
jgi:beta-lactamase regulating signal transducer with metallopeptidase domain